MTSQSYSPSEILNFEKIRWRRIAERYIHFDHPITVLDIGSGSGFIPLTIAHILNETDVFICTDLSQQMLEVARKTVSKYGFPCSFQFRKITSGKQYKLPFDDNAVDVITINSVLHHNSNTRAFLQEVNRVLKCGGLLLIGHEPNRYFKSNRFLWINYLFFSLFFAPERFIILLSRKTRTTNVLWRIYNYIKRNQMRETMRKINETLIQQKLIEKTLSIEEIFSIIEFKARTGFKPDQLMSEYQNVHFETYCHLFWVFIKHSTNRIINAYEIWLRNRFPKFGSLFFIVLKKVRND